MPIARRSVRTASRARTAAATDISPSRYIARVSLRTGKELPAPIDPFELLVHAQRDKHPVEVAAQYLASRLIQLTRNEARVRDGLRLVNRLGNGLAAGLAR